MKSTEKIIKVLNSLAKSESSRKLCYSKKKITLSEIKAAEKKLGVKFPRVYCNFVTKHGAFWFQHFEGKKAVSNMFNQLFTPTEIVKHTMGWKKLIKSMIKDGDEFSDEIWGNMVVFYFHGDASVAVWNSKQIKGDDLGIHDFYSDDMPIDWSKKFIGFEKFLIKELKKLTLKDL